jgi:hypothetical protein
MANGNIDGGYDQGPSPYELPIVPEYRCDSQGTSVKLALLPTGSYGQPEHEHWNDGMRRPASYRPSGKNEQIQPWTQHPMNMDGNSLEGEFQDHKRKADDGSAGESLGNHRSADGPPVWEKIPNVRPHGRRWSLPLVYYK